MSGAFTMHGSSNAALADAQVRLDEVLGGTDAATGAALGPALFAVTGLLDTNVTLRRALSDPARSADDRAGLAAGLLSGQVTDEALQVVDAVVRGRWSSPHDLVDAMETVSVIATVAAAEGEGVLDAVEDDLFRFRRIVDSDPALRAALTGSVDVERKRALLQDLLGGQVSSYSNQLLTQAFVAPRGRGFDRILDDYGTLAAQRRQRLVAHVTVAAPLEDAQRDRLAAALERVYGRAVHLEIEQDADVVGGLRVQVGDEVLDGTVATRLEDARRRFT